MNIKKTILCVSGISLVTVGIVIACIRFTADKRWDQWRQQAATIQTRLEIPEKRPVLYGSSVKGNAWTSYTKGLTKIAQDTDLEGRVRPYNFRKLELAEQAALTTGYAEVFADINEGAHARTAQLPIDWDRGALGLQPLDLLQLRCLANLAMATADTQERQGRDIEAVETLLDTAQLGRDLLASHILIHEIMGGAVIGIAIRQALTDNNFLERLSPQALDHLDEGLKILDGSISLTSSAHEGEAVLFANSAQAFLSGTGPAGSLVAFRYGFSQRYMLADAGLAMLKNAAALKTAGGKPWNTARAAISRIDHRTSRSKNPALAASSGSGISALGSRRTAIAFLRLARMAIAHQRGQEIPSLPDPFGEALQHGKDDKGKKMFWSVGLDESTKLYLRTRNQS